MKYTIFFAFISLCFLFPLTVISQSGSQQVDHDTVLNYTDIHGNKQGQWIQYHPNGNVRYEGFFIDDIPQGTFTRYHRNGVMQSQKVFDDDGSCSIEYFWENGRKAAKGRFNANRERDGLWHIYYTEGSLLSIINYKNGQAEGEVTLFYPGTSIKLLDCSYKDAKLHGEYIKYFNTGRKMIEGNYKNGLRHGHFTFYTPDGFIDEEGYYHHGIKQGEWTRFTLGEVSEQLNYIDGRPENYEDIMQEWEDRFDWAKDNQHLFRDPHEYFDNPYEFFRDRPDPYEQSQKRGN